MSKGQSQDRLHLPSLSISGFRGIHSLDVSRLGRVTLFAGRNGVGKTTVLEACRVYVSRGHFAVLTELGRRHEEYSGGTDREGEKVVEVDLSGLFHGRTIEVGTRIEVGPKGVPQSKRVTVEVSEPSKTEAERLRSELPIEFGEGQILGIRSSFRKMSHFSPHLIAPSVPASNLNRLFFSYRVPRRWSRATNPTPMMDNVTLGPGLIQNDDLAEFWDKVALTAYEERVVEALRLVLGHPSNPIEGITMVGDNESRFHPNGRRVVVKLKDYDKPVPLRSLGDGATRLFGVALALANSRNGFLFIDEAENGIHYSVYPELWKLILQAARENNVQVLATTHGWDCIKGFARAALEDDSNEGLLVRLDRKNGHLHAVEYSESELAAAAEQGIEVR